MGLTPTWRIAVGSEDRTASLAGLMTEIRVTSEAEKESDALELVVAAGVEVAPPGDRRPVRAWMGYGEAPVLMGTYYVESTEIDLGSPRLMTVSAPAADLRAGSGLKAPRTHVWSETTLGAVIRAIAEQHALEPRVAPEIANVEIAHIDQAAESDLALLQRLGREHGYTVKAANGSLIVMPPGAGTAPGSGRKLPGRTVAPGDILRGRVTFSGRPRYGAVQAAYRDAETGVEARVQAGDGDPVFEHRAMQPDQASAEAQAQAQFRRLGLRTATLSLTLPGDPMIAAETPLRTRGWGSAADGQWTVRRARHVLTAGAGFTTEIEAAPRPPTTIPTRVIR